MSLDLAILDARTLLDRAADARHESPIVRTAHYREVAWRIVADLVRAITEAAAQSEEDHA